MIMDKKMYNPTNNKSSGRKVTGSSPSIVLGYKVD